MDTRREGDDWAYEWPEHDLAVVVAGARDGGAGLWAEVSVRQPSLNGNGHILGPLRVNLLEGRTRSDLATQLARRSVGARLDWFGIIETVCVQTVRAVRAGEPLVRIADVPELSGGRELVSGFLPEGVPTVMFADGGTGKSIVALAVGLTVAAGVEVIPGMVAQAPGPAVVLDWEEDVTTHRHRLGGLCRALGIGLPDDLYFRRGRGALAEDAGWLRRELAQLGARLCIVDSLTPATGGDPRDAQPTTALFNALRSLGPSVTTLIVAHMAKAETERTQGRARVYGSVFVENLARSVWELRLAEEGATEGRQVIGFYQRKANWGPLAKPFALELDYDETRAPARFTRSDVREVAGLAERLPLGSRVRDALRAGALSTADLADRLGVSEATIRTTCRRMNDVGATSFGGGRGHVTTWGLRAHGG